MKKKRELKKPSNDFNAKAQRRRDAKRMSE
jgi:hypothetical protein